MKKNTIISTIIILAIIIFAYWVFTRSDNLVDEEVAKCIGENSALYALKGCSACEAQRRMFGTSYRELNVTDCFYDRTACAQENIVATPTWIINGERFEGVQSIEKIVELTGCEL